MERLAAACVTVMMLVALASSPAAQAVHAAGSATITAADCTADRLGSSVPTTAIGEPVRSVTLSAPSWLDAANGMAAQCRVNGSMAAMDSNSTARPINFSVVLPATWTRRAAQLGGGGMNGFVPNLMGGGPGASGPSLLDRGFATYGSDSGHQAAFGGPRGGAPPGVNVSDDWVLNDEAIRNLGYMQMKKTHDAAMVIMVTIGTNDTLASPGAQLDYFQSVVDRMGRANVDQFAHFFVMPQTGHGLSGTSYGVNGDGKDVPSLPIPNRYDQLGLLFDWVENNKAPGMSVTVTADERSLPLCSYPSHPRYRSGAAGSASSYECSTASPTTK